MTSALAIVPAPFTEKPKPYKFGPTGIRISRDLSYEEYEAAVNEAMLIKSAASWAIADLLVYGHECLENVYTQAFEATGRAMKTLYNYLPVGYAFPPEKRVYENLHFDHYREVSVLYLDEDTRHELLSVANVMADGRRDYLRDEKRKIRQLPERVGPHGTSAVVSSDGVVKLTGLPTNMWGKDVWVTVRLLEVAA